MKSTIAKAGGTRKFISPSFVTDVKRKVHTGTLFNWKEAAGLAFGAWSMKRYPKATILGVLGLGIYIGMQMTKDKHPYHGSGIVKNP